MSKAVLALWVRPHCHSLAQTIVTPAPSLGGDKLLSRHMSSRTSQSKRPHNHLHSPDVTNNHDKTGLWIIRLFPTGSSNWNPGRALRIKLLFNRWMDEYIDKIDNVDLCIIYEYGNLLQECTLRTQQKS